MADQPPTNPPAAESKFKPFNVISPHKRMKMHLNHITEEVGEQKYTRLVTAQFNEWTYRVMDPAIAKEIRKSPYFRALDDERPLGRVFEMKEGESTRMAMERLRIQDRGEILQIFGPVDTKKNAPK